MSVCYLTYKDAGEIAKGLRVNKTLTALNASGNFLAGYGRDGKFVPANEGVASIADSLSVSPLTSLSLGENRLGLEGVKALVPGLAKSRFLTSLDLSRNGIGVEGAGVLAAGLAANGSLLKLDVRITISLDPGGRPTIDKIG